MKKIAIFLAMIFLLSCNVFAKNTLMYDDFTSDNVNNWRLYGWDLNHISMNASDNMLSLGLGVGGSSNQNNYSTPYFAQATAGEMNWTDYTLDTTMQFSNKNFEYGGIVVRYQSSSSYYELAFSSYSGGYLCLTKSSPYAYGNNIIPGTKVNFSSIPDFDVTDKNRYIIKLQDNKIDVTINGYNVISYIDLQNSYKNGMIGFNEYSSYAEDSYIYVSELSVCDNSEEKTDIYLIKCLDEKSKLGIETQKQSTDDFRIYSATYQNDVLSNLLWDNILFNNKLSKSFFDVSEYETVYYDDFSKENDEYTISNNNSNYITNDVSDGKYKLTFADNIPTYPATFTMKHKKNYKNCRISFELSSQLESDGYPLEYLRILLGSDDGNNLKTSYWISDDAISFNNTTVSASTLKLGQNGADKYSIVYSDDKVEITINGVNAFTYIPKGELNCYFGIETYSKYTKKMQLLLDNLRVEKFNTPTDARMFCWDNNMRPFFSSTNALNTYEGNEYYVSQKAPDGGDGSFEKPFNSLEKARDVVRMTKGISKKNIDIILMDDIYFVDNTFMLSDEDSSDDGYKITYKGIESKRPIISGGVKLGGFSLYDSEKNIYSANAKGLDFRQLYSKDNVAIRARYPDNDKYLLIKSWNSDSVNVNGKPDIDNIYGAEAVIQKVWGNDILNVSDISDNIMTFDSLSTDMEFTNVNPPHQDNQAFHLENKYEFIDREGEWYLDKDADTVYYKPYSGDDLSEIYVPKTQTLFNLSGKNLDCKIKNISFENLSFAHTDWNYVKENPYVEIQSQQYFNCQNYKSHPEAGIYVKNAENVTFDNVHFKDMGSTGIDFHHGVSKSEITNCCFYDIAGNGISMGTFDEMPNFTNRDIYNPKNENEIVNNIKVENNFITRTGQVYYSAAGILAGNCRDVSILHNEICDLPWSGISLSWGWNSSNPSPARFIVKYNRIYNVLNKVSDGGGIYFCGNAPDSIVSDNYIHNLKYAVYASGAMLTAVYLDQGTKGVTVANNCVTDATNFHTNSNQDYNDVSSFVGYTDSIVDFSGLLDNNIKSKLVYEVARGKSASASSYQEDAYAPRYLTDGSANNNARWIPIGSDRNAWAQVDLGDDYFIKTIKLDSTLSAPYNSVPFRKEFEILGSDDETFSSYDVIATQGSTPWSEGERWIAYLSPQKSYRYIRMRKSPGGFFELSEISVYGCKLN